MIRFYRNKRGISIRKLSKATGISKSHIGRLENGESVPTIYTLKKLADALDVPPSALYFERGKDMKRSRAAVISELIDVCDQLSLYSLMRLVWIARYLLKKEDLE